MTDTHRDDPSSNADPASPAEVGRESDEDRRQVAGLIGELLADYWLRELQKTPAGKATRPKTTK